MPVEYHGRTARIAKDEDLAVAPSRQELFQDGHLGRIQGTHRLLECTAMFAFSNGVARALVERHGDHAVPHLPVGMVAKQLRPDQPLHPRESVVLANHRAAQAVDDAGTQQPRDPEMVRHANVHLVEHEHAKPFAVEHPEERMGRTGLRRMPGLRLGQALAVRKEVVRDAHERLVRDDENVRKRVAKFPPVLEGEDTPQAKVVSKMVGPLRDREAVLRHDDGRCPRTSNELRPDKRLAKAAPDLDLARSKRVGSRHGGMDGVALIPAEHHRRRCSRPEREMLFL